MKCEKCGKNGAIVTKHIHYKNGWITLTEPLKMCSSCLQIESDEHRKAFEEMYNAIQNKYGDKS